MELVGHVVEKVVAVEDYVCLIDREDAARAVSAVALTRSSPPVSSNW